MENRDNYSRNQCTLVIRVDGEELEVPCNFGLSAEEIKVIYPYLANLANTQIVNPAIEFAKKSKSGAYDALTEEEYAELVDQIHKQSGYWYSKSKASLLDLAIRFALDIKFKGIQEIQDAFSTVTPFDRIKTEKTVSSEEATQILKDAGMGADAETKVDTDDEKDVERGSAGNVPVDIYGTGDAGDFLSKELDEMNAANAEDRFQKIVDGERPELPERYQSNYKPEGFQDGQIGEDGLLDLYATNGSADTIFGDKPDDGSTSAEIFAEDEEASDEDAEQEEIPADEDGPDEDFEPDFSDEDELGESED